MKQGKIIDEDGTEYWFKNNLLDREDGPAIISKDGSEYWYKNGKQHRKEGPTATHPNGSKYWHKDGKQHHENGPAIIRGDGSVEYFLNDKRIKEEDYLRIQNCSIDELPLYINTDLAPLVRRRLRHETG